MPLCALQSESYTIGVFNVYLHRLGSNTPNHNEADFLLFRFHYSNNISSRGRDVEGLEACVSALRRGKQWAIVASVSSPIWTGYLITEFNVCGTRVVVDFCMFGAAHRAPLQLFVFSSMLHEFTLSVRQECLSGHTLVKAGLSSEEVAGSVHGRPGVCQNLQVPRSMSSVF